jgi:hypothetical protein
MANTNSSCTRVSHAPLNAFSSGYRPAPRPMTWPKVLAALMAWGVCLTGMLSLILRAAEAFAGVQP